MSFYKEVPGRQTTLESTLKFDTAPTAGSTNPVTSDGVNTAITEAVGGASDALQEQIDDIAEKAGSGYTSKGPASVATLNGLTGQENGWLYTMTDAGTLTDGSLAVSAGDTVAWDATNSVWYKAMDYAPAQYGTNEVHNLPTAITAFRTGDVIPVDGPSGTAKMGKDDLLKETAENAVKSGIAGSGDVTTIIGEDVVDNYYSAEVTIAEDGKYVASNSSVVTEASFAISDSITLDAGETIQILAGGYKTYVAMISSYDGDSGTYTRLVQSDGSDRKLYSYTNNTGASVTIRLSFSKAKKPFVYVKGKLNKVLKLLNTHIEQNNESFGEVADYEKIIGLDVVDNYYSAEVTIAEDGKYVASNSSVVTEASFAISDSITLDAGETIQILAGGYATYVAMISLYDSGTDTYTRLVQSDGSDRKLYSYTNNTSSSIVVRLSYSKSRKPYIYVKGIVAQDEELPELSVFETMGVIGDSYASGTLYSADGQSSQTFYNKSWPQILGRKNGINVTNYSFAGARTNTWLTNATYGLAKLLSDDPLDSYVIVLSINDRNKGGAEWLGSIDDIHVGDPSQNANSFYGCYAKIIENILTHAPNAKIFCVQHSYNVTGLPKDYNDAIAAIANLYGLPCISEFVDKYFSTLIYTQMYGGHPTYVGYAGMADALCRLLRKSMVKYLSYFKEYLPIT